MRRVARRQFLRIAVGGAVALPFVSRFAWAQAYPTRPVRIIVPTGPPARQTFSAHRAVALGGRPHHRFGADIVAAPWAVFDHLAFRYRLDSERSEPFVDIATLFAEKWHQ
jgi:hypothetical protein